VNTHLLPYLIDGQREKRFQGDGHRHQSATDQFGATSCMLDGLRASLLLSHVADHGSKVHRPSLVGYHWLVSV